MQDSAQEKYQKSTAVRFEAPLNAEKKNGSQAEFGQNLQHLWHAAKKNFYYKDDTSKAAELCNRIIAQSALSEEADEAKLLLHDIKIENRKWAEAAVKENRQQNIEKKIIVSTEKKTKKCLYCSKDVFAETMECKPCRKFFSLLTKKGTLHAASVAFKPQLAKKTKISIAIAVLVLPIIGIASGGIVGIGLPEIIVLTIVECVFSGTSKVRDFVCEHLKKAREKRFLSSLPHPPL